MVRSTLSVPAVAIGAVRLAVTIRATSSSIAAVPVLVPATDQEGSLFAALKTKVTNSGSLICLLIILNQIVSEKCGN